LTGTNLIFFSLDYSAPEIECNTWADNLLEKFKILISYSNKTTTQETALKTIADILTLEGIYNLNDFIKTFHEPTEDFSYRLFEKIDLIITYAQKTNTQKFALEAIAWLIDHVMKPALPEED